MGFFSDKTPQLKAPKKVELEKFEAKEVDLGKSRDQVIDSNVESFDDVTSFLDDLNAFNAQASVDVLEQTIPGFTNLRQQLTDRASELASDPFSVPESVQSLLETQAAQRGVATGVGLDSGAGALDLVETFGLTGIQLGQQNLATAQNLANTVTSVAPPPTPVNPFAFLSTTQDQQNANQGFEDRRLATDIRFKESTQQINQAHENALAAVQNQQAVLDSQKQGIGQRLFKGAVGAVSGFATGGPIGAIAGGLGAASGNPFDAATLETLNTGASKIGKRLGFGER